MSCNAGDTVPLRRILFKQGEQDRNDYCLLYQSMTPTEKLEEMNYQFGEVWDDCIRRTKGEWEFQFIFSLNLDWSPQPTWGGPRMFHLYRAARRLDRLRSPDPEVPRMHSSFDVSVGTERSGTPFCLSNKEKFQIKTGFQSIEISSHFASSLFRGLKYPDSTGPSTVRPI